LEVLLCLTTVRLNLTDNSPFLTTSCPSNKKRSSSQQNTLKAYFPVTNICSYTYLELTPQNRVLLEKLTIPQLVKELPAFYGTPVFISVFKRQQHLSQS